MSISSRYTTTNFPTKSIMTSFISIIKVLTLDVGDHYANSTQFSPRGDPMVGTRLGYMETVEDHMGGGWTQFKSYDLQEMSAGCVIQQGPI